MDPNANLREQREIAARLNGSDTRSADEIIADAQRLAELVEALDEWLCKRGFLPSAWQRGPAQPHEAAQVRSRG